MMCSGRHPPPSLSGWVWAQIGLEAGDLALRGIKVLSQRHLQGMGRGGECQFGDKTELARA